MHLIKKFLLTFTLLTPATFYCMQDSIKTKLKLHDNISMPDGGHMRLVYYPHEKTLAFLSFLPEFSGFRGGSINFGDKPISNIQSCKLTQYKNILLWALIAQQRNWRDTLIVGSWDPVKKIGRQICWGIEDREFVDAESLTITRSQELSVKAVTKLVDKTYSALKLSTTDILSIHD